MVSNVSRPHSAIGFTSTKTHFADDILLPEIRKHLEAFYEKASTEDKVRCLELINSLDIGQIAQGYDTPQNRPESAIPFIGGSQERSKKMMTTYRREFKAPDQAVSASAYRPETTRHTQRVSAPVGNSTYEADFKRFGFSSDEQACLHAKRNNPHPDEMFMNWRLAPSMTKGKLVLLNKLTNDELDKVCRGPISSTYQADYLGIPQGYKKKRFDVPEDWKSKVPYTLDSSTRYSYQHPMQLRELRGNITRYGCNKTKHTAADAIVPTVTNQSLQSQIKTRTTYDREFTVSPNDLSQVRDLAKTMGTQALLSYVDKADSKDKTILRRVLDTMGETGNKSPSRSETRNVTLRRLKTPEPRYISTWAGPM